MCGGGDRRGEAKKSPKKQVHNFRGVLRSLSFWLPFFKGFMLWRRGWDLNPRYGFPYARFRGECFQPLSHLSAVGFTRLSDDLASPQRYVTHFEIQPALRSISCAPRSMSDFR